MRQDQYSGSINAAFDRAPRKPAVRVPGRQDLNRLKTAPIVPPAQSREPPVPAPESPTQATPAAIRPENSPLSDLIALRVKSEQATQQADDLTLQLLETAFAVVAEASRNPAVAEAVKAEVVPLRTNRRSDLPQHVILIAFPTRSAALRSRYADALKGAALEGLTISGFRERISPADGGKGGIKSLARVAKEHRAAQKRAAQMPASPSTIGPDFEKAGGLPLDRAATSDGGSGAGIAIAAANEVARAIATGALRPGHKAHVVVEVMADRTLRATAFVGRNGADRVSGSTGQPPTCGTTQLPTAPVLDNEPAPGATTTAADARLGEAHSTTDSAALPGQVSTRCAPPGTRQ
jgi:hypothetical protein